MTQAARDLDVHENVLRKWVQQLADDPLEAFPGSGKMKAAEAETQLPRLTLLDGKDARLAATGWRPRSTSNTRWAGRLIAFVGGAPVKSLACVPHCSRRA